MLSPPLSAFSVSDIEETSKITLSSKLSAKKQASLQEGEDDFKADRKRIRSLETEEQVSTLLSY